eukprot:COSAG05_NODE_579_length_8556_cov_44.773679_12_plen_72_part_00
MAYKYPIYPIYIYVKGFTWNPAPELRYGLWQEKGGPCGVIAATQAALLVQLTTVIRAYKMYVNISHAWFLN